MAWSNEFADGVRAEDSGKRISDNPYEQSIETNKWHEWNDGWQWSYEARTGDPMGDHHGRCK